MSHFVVLLGKLCYAVTFGILAGHALVYIFNKIPPKWLCDYGQEPGPDLKDPYTQRVKGYPWKWLFSAFFTVGSIRLVFFDWSFALAALVLSFALMEIALADKKYGIIPDQFVILSFLAAFGFIPFHSNFLQPLWGVLLGGGVMLLSALLGKLIFKKESLGFGDVKLFSAIGMGLGFRGTAVVLVMSAVISSVVFAILLAAGKVKRRDMLPLGPYICGSAIFYVVIIWPLL